MLSAELLWIIVTGYKQFEWSNDDKPHRFYSISSAYVFSTQLKIMGWSRWAWIQSLNDSFLLWALLKCTKLQGKSRGLYSTGCSYLKTWLNQYKFVIIFSVRMSLPSPGMEQHAGVDTNTSARQACIYSIYHLYMFCIHRSHAAVSCRATHRTLSSIETVRPGDEVYFLMT